MPVEQFQQGSPKSWVSLHQGVERASDDIPATLARPRAPHFDVFEQLLLPDEVQRVAQRRALRARGHALLDPRKGFRAISRIARATSRPARPSLAWFIIRHVILLRLRRLDTRVNVIIGVRKSSARHLRRSRFEIGVAEQTSRSPHRNAFESQNSATHSA